MVDHASTSIAKPKNWQDFERCCRVLFECILNDPHVQRNGRSGQAQHGVDVYGQRGGQGGTWVGVQCKGKDEGLDKIFTEAELRTEVNKARSFEPALSEFIVVTTLPSDARIQEVARQITQENDESGQPLRVAVWGWSELARPIHEA